MVSMVQHRKRLYDTVLAEQVAHERQMAFVTGPRQVGKTTACRGLADTYLNWDNLDDREVILRGPAAIAAKAALDVLRPKPAVITLDELHKMPRWKSLLKGFFDTYSDRMRALVTGSSRLDTYRRGGDSLMGRYFLYRMHPLSVGEIVSTQLPDPQRVVRAPQPIPANEFDALWTHGGYPEPFLRRDARFTRRWSNLRLQQLIREDIRDLTNVQDLDTMEALVRLLLERSGDQVIYSNLAGEVRVAVDTLRRWVDRLCGFYLGFLVRPWFRNVSRSLRKEPKWFLRDWSGIADPGKRVETFVACHLLKAVDGWNDLGLGDFQLGYLRDKEKREVDFLVVRDRKPWFLVEVKASKGAISPTLAHFQEQLGAPHAFQVVLDADYVQADCFASPRGPLAVPAKTFLSQLL